MASRRKTLNPMTDTPADKTDITKSFMLAYMKCEKATREDKIWFNEIVFNPENQKEYSNQLNGTKYMDIDIPKVRQLFCERFYPQLVAKKVGRPFLEEVKDLLK